MEPLTKQDKDQIVYLVTHQYRRVAEVAKTFSKSRQAIYDVLKQYGVDIKDYIWTIPLIGGILLLISFFTPSAYASQFGISEYQWMWGLFHVEIYGYSPETDFFFNVEPAEYMIPIFLSGIFSAIIIFIASIM